MDLGANKHQDNVIEFHHKHNTGAQSPSQKACFP